MSELTVLLRSHDPMTFCVQGCEFPWKVLNQIVLCALKPQLPHLEALGVMLGDQWLPT